MKQKLIIVSILLFAFQAQSNAQEAALGLRGGYNMFFSTPDGLNYIVDRYNETRPFLTEEMEHFSYLDGFTYHFFGGLANFLVEAGYDHRSQTRFARGIDASGFNQERQLRMVLNTGNLGLAYSFIADEDAFVSAGVRSNIGPLRIKTRIGSEDEVGDLEWEEIYDDIYMDFEFNLKLVMQGFSIEPYYTVGLDSFSDMVHNLQEVNQALNPNTHQNDPETISLKANGFGIRIMFAFMSTDL